MGNWFLTGVARLLIRLKPEQIGKRHGQGRTYLHLAVIGGTTTLPNFFLNVVRKSIAAIQKVQRRSIWPS